VREFHQWQAINVYDGCGGGRDLCIDVRAPKKGFKRLEKIGESIVVHAHIVDCLTDVT
jgi:hypothetical protein